MLRRLRQRRLPRRDGEHVRRRPDDRLVEAQLRPRAGRLRRAPDRVRPVDARAAGPGRRPGRAGGAAHRRRAERRGVVPGRGRRRRPRGGRLRDGGRGAGRLLDRRRHGLGDRRPAERGRQLLAENRPEQDRAHEGETPRRGGRAARGQASSRRTRRTSPRSSRAGGPTRDPGDGLEDAGRWAPRRRARRRRRSSGRSSRAVGLGMGAKQTGLPCR